jgi:hypothetical protein
MARCDPASWDQGRIGDPSRQGERQKAKGGRSIKPVNPSAPLALETGTGGASWEPEVLRPASTEGALQEADESVNWLELIQDSGVMENGSAIEALQD